LAIEARIKEMTKRIQEIVGEDLEFVVLFGSYARGDNSPISDIDIGVKTSRNSEGNNSLQLKLAGLGDTMSKPSFDIVLLDNASLTLQYRVVRDGEILYQRDSDAWPAFVEYVISRYPDWIIFLEQHLTESLGL
jgi:predicted nucleotidyltransferase